MLTSRDLDVRSFLSELRFAALPPEVIDKARWCLADLIGTAVAGLRDAARRYRYRPCRGFFRRRQPRGRAVLPADDRRPRHEPCRRRAGGRHGHQFGQFP